jgi:hypothetical protein
MRDERRSVEIGMGDWVRDSRNGGRESKVFTAARDAALKEWWVGDV